MGFASSRIPDLKEVADKAMRSSMAMIVSACEVERVLLAHLITMAASRMLRAKGLKPRSAFLAWALGIYHGTASPLVSVKVGVGVIKPRPVLAVATTETALRSLADSLRHLRGVIPGLHPVRAKGGVQVNERR